jgi:hypothetical protein
MPSDSGGLTVLCLKWGPRYGPEYVNNLQGMVARNLTMPHRFLCITDDPVGVECETRPMAVDVPTFWGKVEAFSHPVPGRILVCDLDTVIVGNIDGFASYDGPFCVTRPFIERGGGVNSGLMSIAADFGRHIWERFAADPEAAIARTYDERDPPWNYGDQRWIEMNVETVDYWQELLPGQLRSYKRECRPVLPPDTRIVAFHGHPDPHEATEPWVLEHWHARPAGTRARLAGTLRRLRAAGS